MILNVFCKKHPKYKALHPPRTNLLGNSCHACWVLFFLSGNSCLDKREVGVRQLGLRDKSASILIAKAVE